MVTWGFKILRSECGVVEFWVFKEERLNLFEVEGRDRFCFGFD